MQTLKRFLKFKREFKPELICPYTRQAVGTFVLAAPRWYVWLRKRALFLRLFSEIVWRKHEGGRISLDTAWQISRTVYLKK